MHGDGIDTIGHHSTGKDTHGLANRNRVAEWMSRRGPPADRKGV